MRTFDKLIEKIQFRQKAMNLQLSFGFEKQGPH